MKKLNIPCRNQIYESNDGYFLKILPDISMFNEREKKTTENIRGKISNVLLYEKWCQIDSVIHVFYEYKRNSLDILEYLLKYDLTIVDRLQIVKKMCKIVNNLHNLGYCHLDISLENFLIDIDSKEVFLIDFEFSTNSNKIDGSMTKLKMMPPELYCLKQLPVDYQPKKIDIYSLGMTIFSVIFDTDLYFNCKEVDVLNILRSMFKNKEFLNSYLNNTIQKSFEYFKDKKTVVLFERLKPILMKMMCDYKTRTFPYNELINFK